MEGRESFVIYKNWAEAINLLPEEFQIETYKALVEYGLTGKIPDNVSAICNAMLVSFSKDMERNIERYNLAVQNGQKGGAPRGNQNARKKDKDENQQVGLKEESARLEEESGNSAVCFEEDSSNHLVALEEDNEENEKQPNDLEENNSKQPNITQEDNPKQPKTTENNLKQPKTSENNLYVYVSDNVNVNDKDNDKKENSLTRVKESEKNSLSPARKKEKHKYGQFKNVLLTEDEYNSLLFGKEAIEYLSYHREMKGYKCKDDNLAIQKWVFDAIKEQRQRKARLENGSGLQKINGLQKESPMTQLGRVLGSNTTGAKM